MKYDLKKFSCRWVLIVFLFLPLLSQTDWNLKDIEVRLARAEGKEKIIPLSDLANLYQQSEPKKSLEYSGRALELLKRFPDEKLRAHILNSMSAANFHLGKYRIAKKLALEGLSIAEQIDDKEGIARARDYLGGVCQHLGEFDQALGYYSKNLKLYDELEDKAGKAGTFNVLGAYYLALSDHTVALDYFIKTLEIYEELDDRKGIGAINSNLGTLYWELRELDKSLEYYHKSLEIEREFDNQPGIAIVLSNIGVIYKNKGEFEKSREHYEMALQITDKTGNKSFSADIYNNIGEIYREQGDYSGALEYFNRGLKIKEELNEKKGIARLLINACAMNRRLDLHREAMQQAERALAIAKEIDVKSEIKDSYLELSKNFEVIKDHRKALDYHKKYLVENESIFNEKNSKIIANLQSSYEVQKKEKENALLKKDRELQRTITVYLIIFSALILLLAFVIFTRYRLKARVTRALQKEVEERKQTEDKLRESEEKFRVLAEQAVVGICIIQENAVKYANPMFSMIFGYPVEEIIGRNPLEFVSEEDRTPFAQNLDKRMTGTDDSIAYEFRGSTKKGQIIDIESYGSLTHYHGKLAVLETIIDVTDRKKAEMEILKIRKLESIGLLAGGIAHDFNNLLTVIIGNISLARSNLTREGTDFKNQTLLENAEKASYQATELAQKFIMFSKGNWMAPRKIIFSDILTETIDLYPEIVDIHYNFSIPGELKPIYGDERQLKQVISNLLINANEAISGQNKDITVKAENIPMFPENKFLLKEGDYVKISIIDKGRGIPANQLEKIFDPYFSTKRTVSQKGLGLGLAICYSIVKKHEGHISVNSEAGKGTTVDVYLPAYIEN